MLSIMKNEWNRMKKIYILVFVIGMLLSCILVYLKISGYSYDYNIQIWQESGEILALIFPALAVLPTCWIMYYERKNSYINYAILRISKNKYIIAKWFISSLYGGLLIFTISITGLIVSLYFVDPVTSREANYALEEFMGKYLVNTPLLYGILLSAWRGIIGFIVTTMGFLLSLYVNNLFVILSGPFIYCILENFILSIFNRPYYRLVTSFSPYIINPSVISIGRLLVGPTILVLIIICIYIYFSVIKKRNIHTI